MINSNKKVNFMMLKDSRRYPSLSGLAALALGVIMLLGACNLADPFASGGNARLILGLGGQSRGFSMPSLDPADVARYDILLKDGAGTASTVSRTSADIGSPIVLSPGSWTVEIKAYDASDNQIGSSLDAQSGTAAITILLAAGDNPVDVPLVPVLGRTVSGKGNASIDFVFQAPNPLVSVAASMMTFSNGVMGAEAVLVSPEAVLNSSTQTLHIALNALASGDYLVKMTASSSSGAYNTVSHMIKVYDNLVTRGTVNITQAMLTEAPPAPINLGVSSIAKGPDSLVLSWTWNQSAGFYPLGYHIYIDGALAGTATGESNTTYTCTGEGGSAATFEVRAYNAAGESGSGAAVLNYVPLVSASPEAGSFTLAANTTRSLGITYVPTNANPKTINWTSTDYSVAYVSGSPNPVIWVGATPGTVTITGTGLDGSTLVTLTVSVQPDLLGLWDFEGGDTTNGANVSQITMSAASPDTSDAFQSVYSLAFAGSGQDISDSSSGNSYSGWNGAWTAMAWVKPDGTHAASDPDQAIFNKQILHVDDGLWLQHDNGPTEVWLFYNAGYHSFNATIPNDEWSHLALVNTGSAIQLYIDGVLQATQITDPVIVQGMSIPMGKVGASTTAGCGFWGRMDNIEFYSRLVDSSQIASRVQKGFATGKGTLAHPYEINTQTDFLTMQGSPNTWFRQMSDIILDSGFYNRFNGYTADNQFRGVYDGNGKTISGFNLLENWWEAGLFGITNGATLKNITLTGSVTRTGTVSGSNAGLLVGTAYDTVIQSCKVTGTVSTDVGVTGGNFGGMAGRMWGGGIIDSLARVDVTGGAYAGGLVGYLTPDTLLVNGVAGALILKSGSVGVISTAQGSSVAGGIAGYVANVAGGQLVNRVWIEQSMHQGNLTADTYTGGIAGFIDDYSSGDNAAMTILNSYGVATTITTTQTSPPVYMGAFAGRILNNGTDSGVYQNCYAMASIVKTASGYGNGFVGLAGGTPTFTSCFFNTALVASDPFVAGANAATMKTLSTYANAAWDIGTNGLKTWNMTDGSTYPYLSWQTGDIPVAP